MHHYNQFTGFWGLNLAVHMLGKQLNYIPNPHLFAEMGSCWADDAGLEVATLLLQPPENPGLQVGYT